MKGTRTFIAVAAMALLLAPCAADASGVFDNMILTPRARAMGGAFVAMSDDESAIFTNPAGLADQTEIGVYASYVDLFGYPYWDLGSLSAVVPTEYGTFGLGARMFTTEYDGVDLESEYTIMVSHGFSLMKDIHSSLAIGYTANLYGLSFDAVSVSGEDLGSANTMGFDIGVLGTLRGRTRFGFFMKNINNPKLGEADTDDLPQWFTGGVAYSPYGGVETSLELQKQDDEDLRACFGVETALTDFFTVRAGLQNNPNRLSAGFGANFQRIRVDYSYTSHAVLPGTHHFGLGVTF
ncbi:MAG: hypothetical protein JXB46_04755 [Candidatus Eisenbacteria bacterium]|nr:hypothetical protein [Candidatus Eisenbacteria bacterium]